MHVQHLLDHMEVNNHFNTLMSFSPIFVKLTNSIEMHKDTWKAVSHVLHDAMTQTIFNAPLYQFQLMLLLHVIHLRLMHEVIAQ